MSRVARSLYLPPASTHVRLAHLVPDLLGVDDDPVEIEDDRGDHSATYPWCTYDSELGAVPSSTSST